MSKFKPFLEKVRCGEAMVDEIYDYVGAWHDSELDVTIEQFLGFTEEEYHTWVMHPQFLGLLIAVHFDDPGFIEAVNDNSFDFDFQLAARSSSKVDLKALRKWLKNRRNT